MPPFWNPVWSELRIQFGPRTWFDWAALMGGLGAAVWIVLAHKPPGYAVGTLAVVAAAMTFSRPTTIQRLIVVVLAAGLFWLETRAIDHDRTENAATIQRIIESGKKETASILIDSEQKYKDTKSKVDASLSKMDDLGLSSQQNLQLSRRNLLNVTGGDSFAYISPQVNGAPPPFELIAWNRGKYVLTGVGVTMMRTTDGEWQTWTIDVGTIPAGGFRRLAQTLEPRPGTDGVDSYWLFISAQNRTVQQRIGFRQRPQDGRWETMSQVANTLPAPPLGLRTGPMTFKPLMRWDWGAAPAMVGSAN